MKADAARPVTGPVSTADLMLDYATGAVPGPVALAVATHLALNPGAAETYQRLNAVGGALLDDLPPTRISTDMLERLLERLDREPREPRALPLAATHDTVIPPVLRPYVGTKLDALPWKSVTPGVEEYVLSLDMPGYRASLLRIAPGKAMPTHTHGGDEITVVLEGAYHDEAGSFRRGDIEIADPSITHKPVADAKLGCVCLAVLSAPVRLTGLIGWFVNPFLKN